MNIHVPDPSWKNGPEEEYEEDVDDYDPGPDCEEPDEWEAVEGYERNLGREPW